MRKSIILSFTVALFFNVSAQLGIDSLRLLLINAREDTVQINLMNKIARSYVRTNPDSTLKYGSEALAFSRKINYREGEIGGIRSLSAVFSFAGDFAKGLEYSLDALKKSEALGEKELIANSLSAVSAVYWAHGDYQQGLSYAVKTKEIYEEIRSDVDLGRTLVNIGNLYLNMGQLDSSRVYFGRALENALRVKDEENVGAVYLNLGIVHSKMKQYDIASAYLKQALPVFLSDGNYLFLYGTYYALGEIFDSTERYDSAFYYGRLALAAAKKLKSPLIDVGISKQLSSLFKKEGRFDSAFIYEEMAMAATDSVTKQQEEQKMRTLTFNEQLRQMDIAEQKRKDADARKRNLELAGIAIFIPSFFFLVLLLGKRKIQSRIVEFPGVLSLLFLFEFIVLLIHPYIARLTHESQLGMLLILVSIAVVLVPLHHRLEKWMREKLSTTPIQKSPPAVVEVPANMVS